MYEILVMTVRGRSCLLIAATGLMACAFAFAQGDANPMFVSESAARQRVKVRVDPEYPATARQFKISGDVVAQITIGTDGKVESLDDAKGNMILQSSVKTVVRKWVFMPYLVEGKAVRFKTSLSFNFRL
ncbi:MAG: outer rane transport energization protein TonB [Bryobacterales bacterium]|nr:outer rane transport energization protein TonB [Bryobacterales bacterium]